MLLISLHQPESVSVHVCPHHDVFLERIFSPLLPLFFKFFPKKVFHLNFTPDYAFFFFFSLLQHKANFFFLANSVLVVLLTFI